MLTSNQVHKIRKDSKLSGLEGVLLSTAEERTRREGTVFYRRRIGDWIRRYIVELVIIVIAVTFGIVTTIVTSNARKVFREAKDIRTALKFVCTQYYAGSTSIYDPSNPTGLANGAAESIAEVSTHDGQVFLYAWDDEENIPLRFEYRKGSYTVVYTADVYSGKKKETESVSQMMGSWDVTYSFSVLKYEAE